MRGLTLSILGLFLATGAASAQDVDVFEKKKSTEWMKILQEGKEVKHRRASLIALEVIGPRIKGVVAAVAKSVGEDTDPEVRREAALVLGRMAPFSRTAIPVLGEALAGDKDGGVREAAAIALGGELVDFAQPEVLRLGKALEDKHPPVQIAAAEALKNMRQQAREAYGSMVGLVNNPKGEEVARRYLIYAVSRLMGLSEKQQGEVIDSLTQVVKESAAPAEVRDSALEALGFLKTEKAVPGLIEGMNAKEDQLRRTAIRGLAPLKEKALEAYGILIRAVAGGMGSKGEKIAADKDNAVRGQAILLLGVLGKDHKETVPALVQAAEKDGSLENRILAIRGLGELGETAKDALKVLENLALNDVRAPVREAARIAAGKVKGS